MLILSQHIIEIKNFLFTVVFYFVFLQDIEEIRSNLLSVKSELETAKLENSQLQEKITDLSKVNDLLHTQFQELGAKAAEVSLL